jgi:hypothetical protein
MKESYWDDPGGDTINDNGESQLIKFEAEAKRRGCVGEVTYTIQKIPNCSIEFKNVMRTSEVKFIFLVNQKTK